MEYFYADDNDRKKLLDVIGVRDVSELLTSVPEAIRDPVLALPEGISEPELIRRVASLAAESTSVTVCSSFLGAGAYEHFIPTVVDYLSNRGEFATSYTPYQAEASQGTLQTIFEYQTMIAQLTGMPIANASMYDASSAMSEAALIALRQTGRTKIIVLKSVHPEYRAVLATYTAGSDTALIEVGWEETGTVDMPELKKVITDDVACVIGQSPNFFGCIESMRLISEAAHEAGALFVAVVNPLSLGVFTPPGEYSADIAVGEAQPLGIPLSYGGPYAGFFTCTQKLMRKMPGRVAGQTTDHEGRRGYVLTIQTREQHIRRERATSNICSNQALCALRATIYMSLLGPAGIKEVARQNIAKAAYARAALSAITGLTLSFTAQVFNEFVVLFDSAIDVPALLRVLQKEHIVAGYPLGEVYPELVNSLLVCVTETKTKEDVDRLVDAVKKYAL